MKTKIPRLGINYVCGLFGILSNLKVIDGYEFTIIHKEYKTTYSKNSGLFKLGRFRLE